MWRPPSCAEVTGFNEIQNFVATTIFAALIIQISPESLQQNEILYLFSFYFEKPLSFRNITRCNCLRTNVREDYLSETLNIHLKSML